MTEKEKDKKTKKEQEVEKEEKTEENEEKEAKTDSHKNHQDMLPPLDFSSIFLPFYTQALFKLGAAEDPITQKLDENIDLAKRFIDLLDLLKEKTKGNLETEEDTLLNNGLHQLKMLYMEKSKIIKL